MATADDSASKNPTTAAMQALGGQAAPDARTRAGLVLLYAEGFERFAPAYLLDERDLVIGRDPSNNLCVPQGAVSRQHARIHYHDGQWALADLGSRNGTLVDGQVVASTELEHLAEIRVGDAIFKFVDSAAEHYARYRIDGTVLGEVEGGAAPSFRTNRKVVGGYQIDRLMRAVERVARSEISVILLGESGTGKEVFAEQIHAWSGRSGAFQAVNCAAIPATLMESELFGVKRGAFSGADRDRPGLVRLADRGTLFLDEIGDMPLDTQAKLLRVLQTKEIMPLGAGASERVDVRIVCATHRDLSALLASGKFRGDLYARLNEYSVKIPPLRERKEDVYLLCRALLARHHRPDLGLTLPFMTSLLHYDFPFNVRELEGTLKRGITLCEGGALDAPHLPDEVVHHMETYGRACGRRVASAAPGGGISAGRASRPTEPELRSLLGQHFGNVAAVGRVLGKERMQVHRWIKKYGIHLEDYRS